MLKKEAKKYAEIARQAYQKEVIKRTVEWFSDGMKAELEEHLDRPGWKDETAWWLFGRLLGEVAELAGELFDKPSTKRKVIKECADIGNFAMMIADVYEES